MKNFKAVFMLIDMYVLRENVYRIMKLGLMDIQILRDTFWLI